MMRPGTAHTPIRRLASRLVLYVFVASTGAAAIASERTALQARLDAARSAMNIPGVSAAVIFADGTVWLGQSGESVPGTPIEAATVFDAGSIGKMFTAAVVLQLAEEGIVDLDAPIDRWLPDLPHADTITPRMLLNHTSGWADAWSNGSLIPQLIAAPTRRWTPHDILAATPAPRAEPEAAWHYSSSGYAALEVIVESAARVPLAELMRERVFQPLDLARTVHGAFDDPEEPLAHAWLDIDNDGSAEDFTALLPATSWRTAAGAAGSIITSARDLAVFTRAFVGGRLHGAVMAARAQQWVDRPDGHRHGLGVIQVDLDGEHLVGHRGHAAGYSAEAWHSAETGRTLVVLTNAHALLLTPMVQALL